ncbi:MAG: primosomal protein N' [Candidatus Omnitrophica bacterium]|nr:Primosomal protein N' [bacterium]NUN94948.1 primosomal protein N' [Candidatus Omnitrophota bacterium]
MPRYAHVVFNNPLRERFTYRIPLSWNEPPPIGARVLAPFGPKKKQLGFVVGIADVSAVPEAKVKELEELLDEEALLQPTLFRLLEWISDYYFCSLGEVLFAAFPFGARRDVRRERALARGPLFDAALADPKTPKKRRVVLACFTGARETLSLNEARALAQVGPGPIHALVKEGALEWRVRPTPVRVSEAEALYQSAPPELNEDQAAVTEQVSEALREGGYRQFLLHGVTGSGKTEVFLRAIDETLRLGRTALVLVPEIALTPQTAARYRGRFPGKVEVLHSGLSQPRRFEAWQRVRSGEIPIVVGTRSAVFAPLANLGLIVVDEEHDPSYKQADPAPRYHARDVATYRGHMENAAVLLGSATPSLESYENAVRKKSILLSLPRRATAHQLPTVQLVDMRSRPPTERILSAEARDAIGETLAMGLQTILFLNRRGHSTQLECRHCGAALECTDCSVTLVWHAHDRSLRCHHCGRRQPEPERCPGCGSQWIRARGYGTEQVQEAVENCFPRAKIERIDLDTTLEQGAHDRILSSFRKGEIEVLVGTQMVSKGLDMPGVRLVVVVQAETALNIADFRAAERSFALLTQVAGRAGRGDHPGLVLVQSYAPSHHSIFSALHQDYTGFRRIENRFRYHLKLPPHTRLLNIRMESEDEDRVIREIKELGKVLEPLVADSKDKECRLLGPAPCPIEKVQARWRWQIQITSRDASQRAALLEHPTVRDKLLKPPAKVRVIVDMDPMTLL